MGRVSTWWLLLLVLAFNAMAEQRELQIRHELMTEVPKDYRNDPHYYYKRYFSKWDSNIKREYQDRWAFHEAQVPYLITDLSGEHFDIGASHFVGKAPSEHQVRHDFASHVFRTRVDGAIRSYLANPERPRVFRVAHEGIEKLRSVEVKVSTGPQATQFQFGYDVFTDQSRIEIRRGALHAGVYHSQFFGSLGSSQTSFGQQLSFLVGGDLGPLPYARIGVRPGAQALDALIAQPLSKTVSTEFISTQPLSKAAFTSTYGVILRCLF